MNNIESINYRDSILKKIHSGEKITSEERRWLIYNVIYNPEYKFPCYQRDIIEITPKTMYKFKICTIKSAKNGVFYPLIQCVDHKNGKIFTQYPLKNIDGKISKKNYTPALLVKIDDTTNCDIFDIFTNDGYISVRYQCTYYDPKVQLHKAEFSDFSLGYGMIKEAVENKIIYHCRSPLSKFEEFDDFAFSVEWLQI